MRRMIERTFKGTTAPRVAPINDIGVTGDPQMLAARWDAYIRLLVDPDSQVRAAAFTVASHADRRRVAKYNAQSAPGAAAAARTPPVTIPAKPRPAGRASNDADRHRPRRRSFGPHGRAQAAPARRRTPMLVGVDRCARGRRHRSGHRRDQPALRRKTPASPADRGISR
jgi:hypothetical protein